MRRLTNAVLLCAALGACGGRGSSPAGPAVSQPANAVPVGSELVFVSGETGQPVVDATVVAGGTTYRTDAAGRVRLTQTVLLFGVLDVLHQDHLDRQTTMRETGERRFTSWPRRSPSGLDEDFTKAIVYTTAYATDNDRPPGNRSLQRPPQNQPVGIRPSMEIQADDRLMPLVHEGVAIINSALGLGVYRVETTGPAAPVAFSVGLEPNDPDCDEDNYAFVDYAGGGWTINGGRIVYCRDLAYFQASPASRDLRDYFLATLVHELGHTFGLGHTNAASDLMYRRGHWLRYRADREFYSAREELALRLMSQRPPGTSFPDNDRVAVGIATTWRELIRN